MPALTRSEWSSTFAWYRGNADGPAQEMAAMLEEIVNIVDHPGLDSILDAYANKILRREPA